MLEQTKHETMIANKMFAMMKQVEMTRNQTFSQGAETWLLKTALGDIQYFGDLSAIATSNDLELVVIDDDNMAVCSMDFKSFPSIVRALPYIKLPLSCLAS